MKRSAVSFKGPDPKYPALEFDDNKYDYAHGLPDTSYACRLIIRPTNYVIRTFNPHGVTQNGLYVEKNEKWPRVWAHILACSFDNPLYLHAGDFIVFRRHCEEYLGHDEPENPQYPGETLPVELLNYRAITALIEDSPIEVRY